MDNETEKKLLEAQVEKLKGEVRDTHSKTRLWIFLAVWFLPLVGMSLVQGDNPPPTVGPISIWGIWFLGVPIATWLVKKLDLLS